MCFVVLFSNLYCLHHLSDVLFLYAWEKMSLLLEFMKYSRDITVQGDGTLLPHFHFDEAQCPKDMSQYTYNAASQYHYLSLC